MTVTSELLAAFAILLIISGACILFASLLVFRRLIRLLPKGNLRNKWKLLFTLSIFFIIGYVSYVISMLLKVSFEWHDLIVGIIFFFGAIFVWLSSKTTVRTILDVRRIAKLKAESITDPLTGIFNRRYLMRRLKEEIERSHRYKTPLSLAIFDIDNFKMINDTYGHLVGDKVLILICSMIQENIRKTDFAARYGGEEICILMPDTKPSKAFHVAERIRTKIQETSICFEQDGAQLQINVTVSVGIASLSNANSPEELIKQADNNLYKAKRMGKNMVIGHNEPDHDETSAPLRLSETASAGETPPQ